MSKRGNMIRFTTGVSVITLSATVMAQELTPMELLGKALFFDDNLSTPPGQSCAACHGPEVGWTGPDTVINAGGAVYEGALEGRFGNRKPPSSAYATSSPIFHFERQGSGKGVGKAYTSELRARDVIWRGKPLPWGLAISQARLGQVRAVNGLGDEAMRRLFGSPMWLVDRFRGAQAHRDG